MRAYVGLVLIEAPVSFYGFVASLRGPWAVACAIARAPGSRPRGKGREEFVGSMTGALSTRRILAFILVLAFVGFRVYLDTQWYVGVSDGRVAVFRGMPAEIVGFDLYHVVVETTIPAEDATALALYRNLDDGITAHDRAEADAIVERIRDDVALASGLSPEPVP